MTHEGWGKVQWGKRRVKGRQEVKCEGWGKRRMKERQEVKCEGWGERKVKGRQEVKCEGGARCSGVRVGDSIHTLSLGWGQVAMWRHASSAHMLPTFQYTNQVI